MSTVQRQISRMFMLATILVYYVIDGGKLIYQGN